MAITKNPPNGGFKGYFNPIKIKKAALAIGRLFC